MLGISASNIEAYEKPSEILEAFRLRQFDVILLGGKLDKGFSGAFVLADLLHQGCTTPIIAVSTDPVLNGAMQEVAHKHKKEITILDVFLDNRETLKKAIEYALSPH